MPTPKKRSIEIRNSVIASTGVARTKMMLVAYMVQTKSGSRNHVNPGALILWMVTMKLSPVRIDEKPTTKTPAAAAMTWVLENIVENGV